MSVIPDFERTAAPGPGKAPGPGAREGLALQVDVIAMEKPLGRGAQEGTIRRGMKAEGVGIHGAVHEAPPHVGVLVWLASSSFELFLV